MREILFRGKSVETGKWIYGNVVFKTTNAYSKRIDCGIQSDYCYPEEVDQETVGQYTGIADKNVTKIFEGDILTLTYQNEIGTKIYTKTVLFAEAMFILASECGSGASLGSYDTRVIRPTFEVIGNIHEVTP